jgi:hypothetical protein
MLPSEEQIHSLIRTGDVFKYAVVGFTAIEAAIDELISDSLHTSHRLELKRLSTDLKVDLLLALGSLRKDSKGLLIKLSKARNYYAHEFVGAEDYCPPQELISCFGKHQRETAKEHIEAIQTFKDALRVSFITAYYDVLAGIERLKEIKRKREEHLLHVEAILAVTKEPVSSSVPPGMAQRATDRLNQAIEEKKRELIAKKSGNAGGE